MARLLLPQLAPRARLLGDPEVGEAGAHGASSLTFLDGNGKVLNQLTPSAAPK